MAVAHGGALALLAPCLLATVGAPTVASTGPAIEVVAPASLADTVRRIERIDLEALGRALHRGGLALPPSLSVVLVAEDDPRARSTPPWVVGVARGPREIVIFPARVAPFPHDSIESVFGHEVTHLALDAAAGGRPLPRWFHEGVAMSVTPGWRLVDQARLLGELAREPSLAGLETLFATGEHLHSARAYLLAAALVDDLQRRHGAAFPGDVARAVAAGAPFDRAFAQRTGHTPDAAAEMAWASYRRWSAWLPVVTSGIAVWLVVLGVAAAAFIAGRRRRARLRRRWDTEEEAGPDGQDCAERGD